MIEHFADHQRFIQEWLGQRNFLSGKTCK